jgi:hypothetical protein
MHELAMQPGISLTRNIDNVTEEEFRDYEDLVSSLDDNVQHPLRDFVNNYSSYF